MTITEKALADLLLRYFTTLEPVGRDVTLKNEMKKIAQPDGSTKVRMVPTKGDAYIPKDLSNAMSKAIAKAIHPNLTITGANSFEWRYLSTVLPAGVSPSSMIAVYQFDGSGDSLTDRSGNGNDLQVATGTEAYAAVPISRDNGYFVGFAFDETQRLSPSGSSAPFQLTGAMTGEALFVFEGNTGTSDCIFCCTPATDTENPADNHLYQLNGHQDDGRFYVFWETGSGVNVSWIPHTYCYPGLIQHVVLTRSAAGLTRVFQNGFKVAETTLTLPTGGGNCTFSIGDVTSSIQKLNGMVFSNRMLSVDLSEDQVLESYKRVRGIIT